MIGYFLVLGNRRGFCYGSSVQYGEEHVSIRPTFTAYLPDLSHFIIFIGRREQSSAEVERSSLSLSFLGRTEPSHYFAVEIKCVKWQLGAREHVATTGTQRAAGDYYWDPGSKWLLLGPREQVTQRTCCLN